MSLYAHRSWRLAGQVTADVLVVVWVVVWWLLGRAADTAVRGVADPARRTASSAGALAADLRAAADRLGAVPGVGDTLRTPFDQATGSLGAIVAAAQQQVQAVERLATWGGALVFVIPVSVVLAFWLPARVRFVRRSRAAQRFVDARADLDLFALRAMTNQPMHVLARISDDPVGAWRRGDRAVIDALAESELRRVGLRPPDRTALAPTPPGPPE
ncbi:hypothetical protein FHX74_003319 [Friedmanniella endophytica]|uniref:Uncharacterized protein n=1 Tax=Microlunatus kandeliicorticis TaxID=1759536 RepID=A0A7W3IUU0_9ACTN|nr:hypothetical protein [Microlunatus kandeliicorticis]MBA8795683.1 hypothetical protein [Microlunatus kandeliicorticis]